MKASVIVITRNRAQSISETLETLSGQDYPDFEVIVVDSSDEREQQATEELAARYHARYIREARRGQALARNTGIAEAAGDIIAFTDDDCVPAKDWLTQKVKALQDSNVWCCTGRVIQHNRDGAADLFEEVAGQDLGTERREFTRENILFGPSIFLNNVKKIFGKHLKSGAPAPFGMGHGSSMAFKVDAFRELGSFDEKFGGESILKYGIEDIEFFYRILKSGHSVVYQPSAIVRHKHKLTLEEVFKTRAIYSYTGATFMRDNRNDTLMRLMFYGRLAQLLVKNAQYRLLQKNELVKSFGSDLQGFLQGWSDYRRYCRSKPFAPHRIRPVK